MERRKEGLTGERLDQAFQEGIEWLDSLKGREIEIRDSNATVRVSGGVVTEEMGLGPEKVKSAEGYWVDLKFPGGVIETYEISDISGLREVTKLGGLRVNTTILGELPIHGVRIQKSSWNWDWEHGSRYKLVWLAPGYGRELEPEELETRKLKALNTIGWLKQNIEQ